MDMIHVMGFEEGGGDCEPECVGGCQKLEESFADMTAFQEVGTLALKSLETEFCQ